MNVRIDVKEIKTNTKIKVSEILTEYKRYNKTKESEGLYTYITIDLWALTNNSKKAETLKDFFKYEIYDLTHKDRKVYKGEYFESTKLFDIAEYEIINDTFELTNNDEKIKKLATDIFDTYKESSLSQMKKFYLDENAPYESRKEKKIETMNKTKENLTKFIDLFNDENRDSEINYLKEHIKKVIKEAFEKEVDPLNLPNKIYVAEFNQNVLDVIDTGVFYTINEYIVDKGRRTSIVSYEYRYYYYPEKRFGNRDEIIVASNTQEIRVFSDNNKFIFRTKEAAEKNAKQYEKKLISSLMNKNNIFL